MVCFSCDLVLPELSYDLILRFPSNVVLLERLFEIWFECSFSLVLCDLWIPYDLLLPEPPLELYGFPSNAVFLDRLFEIWFECPFDLVLCDLWIPYDLLLPELWNWVSK